MSVEAEAAERVLRMEIMLTEAAVKLAATGAVNLAMLLIAAVRNEVNMGGRTNVAKMLEQGKQITAFPINTDSLTKFAELAKKHKLACGYIPDPQNPATTNVVIKTEDAELANKIRKDAGIEILPGIDEKTERRSVRQRIRKIREYNAEQVGINNNYDDDEEQSDDQSYSNYE